MLGRLLLLFLVTPVVELALLIRLGDWIGFWPTVAIILITGLAGTYLAKREGLAVWRRLNERLQEGGIPGKELLDGVIILIAGALLITPGVLTDVVGFAGLLPPTRYLLRGYLSRRIQNAAQRGSVRLSFFGFESHQQSPGDSQGAAPSSLAGDEADWHGQPRNRPHHRN